MAMSLFHLLTPIFAVGHAGADSGDGFMKISRSVTTCRTARFRPPFKGIHPLEGVGVGSGWDRIWRRDDLSLSRSASEGAG